MTKDGLPLLKNFTIVLTILVNGILFYEFNSGYPYISTLKRDS